MVSPLLIAIQAGIFILGSAALVYVSRRPLRDPRSHGFYRFFAWEAILALAALNLPIWFRDPFSPPQVTSWLLLTLSAFLVIHGVWLLRQVGRPQEQSSTRRSTTDANYAFENTAHLVKVGAYRFIRHPLYASLIYLAWGIYFKQPASLLGLALALAACVFLWLTARADEAECCRAFGAEYQAYMRQTRMFIPFIF